MDGILSRTNSRIGLNFKKVYYVLQTGRLKQLISDKKLE